MSAIIPNQDIDFHISSRDLLRSLALHLGLVGLFALFAFLFSLGQFGSKLTEEDKQKMQFIQSSIRVDVVAMPKLTLKELQVQVSAEKPVAKKTTEESVPKEAEAAKKVVEAPEAAEVKEKGDELEVEDKEAKSRLQDLLKSFEAKKLPTADEKRKNAERAKELEKEAIAKEFKQKMGQLILEGNKLSKGSGATGVVSEDYSLFNAYVENIVLQVRQYWVLPSYLAEKNLKCRIRLFISKRGVLLRTSFIESSGVADYDQLALEAISRSAPFPPPHADIASQLVDGEVALGFPL